MDTRAKIGLGVGGAVIALGAAVGVGALAANLGGTDTATTQTGSGQDGTSGRNGGGNGARGGMDSAELAKTLAAKLGVDETTMSTALKEVTAASRPAGAPSGQPSGQPSARVDGKGPGGSAYVETMAKALATKLNLDEAKVLAALQEAITAQRTGK